MRLLTLIALCLSLFLTPTVALAKRVALVIGNSQYQNAGSLPNAAVDAGDMADRLRALGFEVFDGQNLTRSATLSLLDRFSQALQPDDLALFYYAGHGVQIGSENYVIPVEARPKDQVGLTEASVRLQTILRTMELRSNRRIVILDACRNNPFIEKIAARSAGDVTRGLAKVEAGVGSFIAFSTQPGNVALDGKGRNSPFTAALLNHIGTQGADIHTIMRKVRGDVVAATNQTQVPWENSSLVDEVYLTGATATPAPSSLASKPAPIDDMVELTVHFVSGLDPDGDGFLALRDGTSSGARRLAKMPEGTLLQVLSQGNPWWYVRTGNGIEGYAHSRWIGCCTTVRIPAHTGPAPVRQERPSCEALWYARNLIWHENGYCFSTQRAIQTFGNESCYRGQTQASIQLSTEDRAEVNRLVGLETQYGCR